MTHIARLVGRLELSRRLTGTKKSNVYNQCKPGGRLHAAMVGDKIDLNHKNAKMFSAEFGYVEPDMVAERKKATTAARKTTASTPQYDVTTAPRDYIPPDGYDEDDDLDAVQYMDLTLREIVKKFGKQAQFKDLVSAYKILVSTQQLEEKIARDRRDFCAFSHLERLVMHFDGLHKQLLGDVSKNIAETVKTLIAAGAGDVEVRKAVTKVHEQVIKMAKVRSDGIIRNAKR